MCKLCDDRMNLSFDNFYLHKSIQLRNDNSLDIGITEHNSLTREEYITIANIPIEYCPICGKKL